MTRNIKKIGLIMLIPLLFSSGCTLGNRNIERWSEEATLSNELFVTQTPYRTPEVRVTETEVTFDFSPKNKAKAFLILSQKLTEVHQYSCPIGCKAHLSGCDIKGNISYSSREKIYHAPGQEYYNSTVITPMFGERWFCTEEDAIANGWRKSQK